MRIPFAVVADGANISREGKLNILGIFDTIYARSFPVTHAEMKLVIRVESAPAEAGTKHVIEIKLVDEEGRPVLGMKADVVPRGAPHGRSLRIDQVLSLHNVTFKKPGKYYFSVLVDSEQQAAVALRVSEAPAGAAGPGGKPGPGGSPPGTAGTDPGAEGPQYH